MIRSYPLWAKVFNKSVYSEGFSGHSVFLGTSGNICLNAAPRAVSGSSAESLGWVSSLLAEG
jgi:hypothetical protein